MVKKKQTAFWKTTRKFFEYVDDAIYLLSDSEVEMALIGSVIIDAGVLRDITIEPGVFFNVENQRLWEIVNDLNMRGTTIDVLTVGHEMHTRYPEDFTRIGGGTYLKRLIEAVPTGAHATAYAELLQELHMRRKLVSLSQRIAASAAEMETDYQQIMDTLQAHISNMGWPNVKSRYVEFKDVRVIMSSPPVYVIKVHTIEKEIDLRLESDDLDKRATIKRKIREALHFNPVLPPRESWDSFINNLLEKSVKKIAPAATHIDDEVCYWVREWYKKVPVAEQAADLQRGYVLKDNEVCVQPQPLVRWLRDNARITITSQKLWVILECRGARRDMSVRIGNESRKLWGIPRDFFDESDKETIEELTLDDFDNL